MLKALGTAVTAMALAAVPANAGCWTPEETSAAAIRELQSKLMVAALRCQVVHLDMTSEYNAFLKANKSLIQRENDRIRAHFVKAVGPVAGQRAYDAFATHLANGFGAEGSSAEICTSMASLAKEGELLAGSEDGMLLLAQKAGVEADTAEGRCGEAGVKGSGAKSSSSSSSAASSASGTAKKAKRRHR